jgi:hypothetical protein
VAQYKIKILKVDTSNEVRSDFGTINPTDAAAITIPFTFKPIEVVKDQEPSVPVSIINVTADVHKSNILSYRTSDGQSGFVNGDLNLEVTLVGNSNYIEFIGDKNEQYFFQAKVSNPASTNQNKTYDSSDFKLELGNGKTIISLVTSKNNVPTAPDAPIINVSQQSYTWNINDDSSLEISYNSNFSDYVQLALGKIQRKIEPNGILKLSKSDFTNGIGNYTLYLQPVSNVNGSGELKTLSVNVISKSFLPGPDITNISYPSVIKGKDFAGLNVEFDISYQSIYTNYIEIYVGKKDKEFALGRFPNSGLATFNVADIIRKSKKNYSEDSDNIQFNLLLIPYNIEGDSITEGKTEEISILFDKGDLKLNRGKVVSDIREAFSRNLNTQIFKDEISNLLTHYAHFGNGDNKLIATWAVDTETFSEYEEGFNENGERYKRKTNDPKSLVIKLYEPLPTSVELNQTLWISKIQSIPIIEQITIVGDILKDCTQLTPNFSVNIGDEIGYQILDDLIASGSSTSNDLVKTYLSSSDFSLDNLDFQFTTYSQVVDDSLIVEGPKEYAWSNFVKYSSASERVENFYYKIKLLEFYNSKYNTLTSGSTWTGSVSILNESNRVQQQINQLKNGFDSFEKWLFESSSEDGFTYPKSNYTGSFLNPTGSDGLFWYNSTLATASLYDANNKSNLVNNLPEHVQNDEEGQEFILFFNMLGQHFDIVWSYIKGLQNSKKLEQKYEIGIKDDLVYHMLESLGWNADMGVKSQFLWEYAFGKHSDGTQISSMSGKDRQHEIWRRLLNNLPYLNKHKGTKRALHAAMACYGIPASLLTIMEFGGPQDPQINGTTKFTFEDRTAALNLSGSNNITIDWKSYEGDFPNSVQFRINTTTKQNQVIAEVPDSWKLEIISSSNYLGNIKFSISASNNLVTSSTNDVPIFYDDYYTITLNKTVSSGYDVFNVYVKEGFNGRIRNSGSLELSTTGSTSWKTGSTLQIGGISPYFSGSIDEFRLWKTALSESRIENHTLIPDGIDGNHVSSSTIDLIFRNDFEYPKNRGVDFEIKNVAYVQSYETASIANSFSSIATYPYNYTPYDRDVTAVVPQSGFNFSNKFRFEKQYDTLGREITADTIVNSEYGLSLDYKSRSTKKSFDTAPIDTDRLGLFFSPIKEINMDILKSLGNFNIDDYIGNPSDEYNYEYSDLKRLRNYYFKRFELNFNEYVQLVRYIDKSLFDTLESLVPARAKVSSGLLIEPHILERSKVQWSKPDGSINNYEVSINTEEDRNITGTNEGKESLISATENILFDVTNPQYEGKIIDTTITNIEGSTSNYTAVYSINDTSAQYGFMTINSGSDMGGISIVVDAELGASLVGQYDSSQFIQVNNDPNSLSLRGFGLFGSGSYTIRTYIDNFGNTIKERVKVFKIKESYTEKVPTISGSEGGNYYRLSVPVFEEITKYRTKVTILPLTGSDGNPTNNPSVQGNIVEVTPLNGYFVTHHRNVGDLTTGLENSYFNGSKQTSQTTIDGGSPVVTFTTNPNTLRVSDTGRGSGEPILIVE